MEYPEITGHLILMMAPSGSGKGTLTRHIQEMFPHLSHTISCTTRAMRPHEEHGKQYYFLSRTDFEKHIVQNDFIEWAEYSGNLYGTLHSELTDRLTKGELVLCEIDIQGVMQLIARIPEKHRTIIYIDAGDWEVLKKRALARAPMSQGELTLRHDRFLQEVSHKDIANFVVYNRDGGLEEAKKEIEIIIKNIIQNVSHA